MKNFNAGFPLRLFRTEKSREIGVVIFIFVAAFLFRYWHLTSLGWVTDSETHYLGMKLSDNSILHFSDSNTYTILSDNLLSGKGANWPFNPPFTIFVLAAIYYIFGKSFFIAKLIYALMGSGALVSVYIIARELYGRRVALLTMLLCSASFALIFITGGLNIENVYLFTSSLAICLFVLLHGEKWIFKKRPYASSFAFGVVCGTAMLSRAEFVIVLAAMFFYGLFKREWTVSTKMKIVASVVAGMIVFMGPWTYRNYLFMTRVNVEIPGADLPVFVPVSLNGPFNFIEGHHPKATGTYAPDLVGPLKAGYIASLEAHDTRHLMFIRDGYSLGWDLIKKNPGKELKLIPVKLRVLSDGFANGFFLNNFPVGIKGGSENMADSFVPDSKFMAYAGGLAFLAGLLVLVFKREKRKIEYLPLIPLCAVLFITIAFYGLSRMAYPVLPYYYMVISIGLAAFAKWANLMDKVSRIPIIVVIIALLAVGFAQSREKTVLYKEDAGGFGKFRLTFKEKIGKDF